MEQDIVLKKYKEWTDGLKPVESRISLYKHVRDIPYAIIPALRDPKTGPNGLLSMYKGSCQPKHYLLASLFGKLDIPVKYATYAFRWSDCVIKYPDSIRQLLKKLPLAYHLACKAYIDGKWILVDATYDLALRVAGFPVNEGWDGVSNTVNAVPSIEEALHDTPEERVRYVSERSRLNTEMESALYSEFIEKFNDWLVAMRAII